MPRKLGKLRYKTPFHFCLSPGLACCCYLAFLVQDFVSLKEQPTFCFVKKYKHMGFFSSNLSIKDLFGKTGGRFVKWPTAQSEVNSGCTSHLL